MFVQISLLEAVKLSANTAGVRMVLAYPTEIYPLHAECLHIGFSGIAATPDNSGTLFYMPEFSLCPVHLQECQLL